MGELSDWYCYKWLLEISKWGQSIFTWMRINLWNEASALWGLRLSHTRWFQFWFQPQEETPAFWWLHTGQDFPRCVCFLVWNVSITPHKNQLVFKTQTHHRADHIAGQQDHKQTLLISARNWSPADVPSQHTVAYIVSVCLADWAVVKCPEGKTDTVVSYVLFLVSTHSGTSGRGAHVLKQGNRPIGLAAKRQTYE